MVQPYSFQAQIQEDPILVSTVIDQGTNKE
jgi:hypothetical protein